MKINEGIIFQRDIPPLEEMTHQGNIILEDIKLYSLVIFSYIKTLIIKKNIVKLIGLITNLQKISLLTLKVETILKLKIIPLLFPSIVYNVIDATTYVMKHKTAH